MGHTHTLSLIILFQAHILAGAMSGNVLFTLFLHKLATSIYNEPIGVTIKARRNMFI